MNFGSHAFQKIDSDGVYEYVQQRQPPDKRMYLFFDEIQRVPGWEDAINSFRVDFNCDIYITGSNAYLLSSEYSTYLSGRYVEIKMLPLSFREFLYFHNFKIKETKSALGGMKKQVLDPQGTPYDFQDVFHAYMHFGGMPGIVDIGLNQEKALILLEGIYATVVVRDILERGFLRTLGKYYIVDIGLRNYLLGFQNRDSGHALENIIYFELIRRGFDVSIGKICSMEVDFIAVKADCKIYVQVTESMADETVRRRELTPLQKINDNYEKIILSMNPGMDSSYDGIKSM